MGYILTKGEIMQIKETCLKILKWSSTNLDKLSKRIEQGDPLKNKLKSVHIDAERIVKASTLEEARTIAKVIIKKIG